MAVKYSLEYNDIEGVIHGLSIYDDDFSGDVTEILGAVTLDYSQTNDPMECIRGSGLRVQLEANSALTFSDLYAEEEKSFQVIYKRAGTVKFTGWLNPEGWYEDFVNDKWIVSFDCVDGLGSLTDLALTTGGAQITDKKTQLEMISLALIRTGIQAKIHIEIDVVYTGLSTSLNVLANVNVRGDRYVKDDNKTIMSCEDVIRDILEPYGAVITTYEGEWIIYRPNALFGSATFTGFSYTYLGVADSPTTKTIDTAFSLGSHINDFYPHHAQANQKISNARSIGAVRINYKYGLVKSFLSNIYLDGTTTIDGWTVDSTANNLTLNDPGVSIDITTLAAGIKQMTSDALTLAAGIKTNYKVVLRPNQFLDDDAYFVYQVTLYDGVDTYYLSDSGGWIANVATTEVRGVVTMITNETGFYSNPSLVWTIELESEVLPVGGDIQMLVWTPEMGSGDTPNANDAFDIQEISISNQSGSAGIIKGENHTFQRTTKPSSKAKDVIKVATGDNASDTYVGTLYKADGTTPTATWNRIGITETIPIIQLMGEEILRLSQDTSTVFSGSVRGYFDYFSRVAIAGVTGVFGVTKYSNDTKNNIIDAEFRQIFGAELTDVAYDMDFDYGNAENVKPTIRG